MFFAMTVERAVTNRYGTRTHLMDIKYLSPLIVSIVRDGALFYMLYVMCTLISFVPMVVSLFDVARLFGVCSSTLLSSDKRSCSLVRCLPCSHPTRQYRDLRGLYKPCRTRFGHAYAVRLLR